MSHFAQSQSQIVVAVGALTRCRVESPPKEDYSAITYYARSVVVCASDYRPELNRIEAS